MLFGGVVGLQLGGGEVGDLHCGGRIYLWPGGGVRLLNECGGASLLLGDGEVGRLLGGYVDVLLHVGGGIVLVGWFGLGMKHTLIRNSR